MPAVTRMADPKRMNELIAVKDIPCSVPGVGLIREGEVVPREVPKEVVRSWMKQKPAIVVPRGSAGDEGWWNDPEPGEKSNLPEDPLAEDLDPEVQASLNREQEQKQHLHELASDDGLTPIDRAQRAAGMSGDHALDQRKPTMQSEGRMLDAVNEGRRDQNQIELEKREKANELAKAKEVAENKSVERSKGDDPDTLREPISAASHVDQAIPAGENTQPSTANYNLLPEQTSKDAPKSVQELQVQENNQIPVKAPTLRR